MRTTLKYLGFIVVFLIALILSQLRCNIPVEKLKPKYTNAESKFIAVDGMQVHYRVEGNGPPLLLLHGMAASLHTWEGWAQELKNDFKVISLDLPAFGLTGPQPQGNYAIEYYVDFLHRFTDQLGIPEFHLAGQLAWRPYRLELCPYLSASGKKTDID